MDRRSALAWISRLLAMGVSAAVALPGAHYIVATVRRNKGSGPIKQRVARLKDLKPDEPFQVAVVAQRTDAWTVYPEQTAGRAWLIRRTTDTVPPQKSVVEALSTICPHLGCSIGLSADKQRFQCPCHNAVFTLEGTRTAGPSPRPMDSLPSRIIEVDGDWWVEITYEQFAQGSAAKIPLG